MSDTTDRALTVIYRQYVERLRQDAPESLRLLKLLAFVAYEWVPPEYAMSYLLEVPYIKRNMVMRGQLAYEAAVRPLEALSLIQIKPGYGISMSLSAQGILRRLFTAQLRAIIGRAVMLENIDRSVLYDEGWHALTVVGRNACNRVLFVYARDTLLDGGKLVREGEIEGARWQYLTHELWQRLLIIEHLHLMLEHWQLHGEAIGANWVSGLLASKADRHRLQQEEIEEVVSLWLDVTERSQSERALRATQRFDAREWVDGLLDSFLDMMSRYKGSPFGQLDLAIVDALPVLTEQQMEQTRQEMYAAFEGAGFGVQPEPDAISAARSDHGDVGGMDNLAAHDP